MNLRGIGKYAMLLGLISHASSADVPIGDNGKLTAFGDVRLRLEADWDSKRSNGTERDDRDRLRTRLRFGMNFEATERLSMAFRVRTGSDDSQQSPHITLVDFNGNDTGDAHLNFDKWFLRYDADHLSAWVGRNSLPMWKPDELFWDDDVTPAGLGLQFQRGRVTVNAGYLANPAGMENFTGSTALVQAVLRTAIRDVDLLIAGGLAVIDGERDHSGDVLLAEGNGRRDYQLWTGNVQASTRAFQKPLRFNFNYYHNSEDYDADDSDAFTAFHRDETDGYVLSARLGGTGERGDWLLGYYYAHIETLAVNNSFAQDDWLRWGSATQTRASNFEGSELRAAWGLGRGMNIVARLYLVDAIEPRTATSLAREDGKRFRVDFNWRF